MKIDDPKKIKHKVNQMIKAGKFENIKLSDKGQLKITYNNLKQKDPDGYYELSDNYLVYLGTKSYKVVAYSI